MWFISLGKTRREIQNGAISPSSFSIPSVRTYIDGWCADEKNEGSGLESNGGNFTRSSSCFEVASNSTATIGCFKKRYSVLSRGFFLLLLLSPDYYYPFPLAKPTTKSWLEIPLSFNSESSLFLFFALQMRIRCGE